MKVDLDGLARNIKSCIDPKKDTGGWAGMVDEMVDHIRQLEANVGGGDTAISQLNQHIEYLESRIQAMNQVFIEIRMAIGGNGFAMEPIEEPDFDAPWLPVGLHLKIDDVMERVNRG